MILADLPPVGERIELRSASTLPEFEGYTAVWLDCGTSALALALLHAREQRPDLDSPEVIVPAYACPDLIAAAVYAGVRPVLVDIGADDPGFDLAALERGVNENTLVVMAVNFLGIRDRVQEIKALLPAGVVLLEDNAQWYPELAKGVPLVGEYAITSFGRGKPASVLGGGMLLVRHDVKIDSGWLTKRAGQRAIASLTSRFRYRSKVMLYNLLRQPRLYFWLNRNPLLKLGETRYTPLECVRPMPPTCQSFVNANIRRHLAANRWREKYYNVIFAEFPDLKPLGEYWRLRCGRQLRYGLLCRDRSQRDTLLKALQDAGLGASSMYRRPLLEIPGVAKLAICRSPARSAKLFADCLLTLPLHSGVRDHHLTQISSICSEVLGGVVGYTRG